MKRHEKTEMLQTVAMLLKANDSIMRFRTKNACGSIMDAFSQCQESAIVLGNHLEALGEVSEPLVHKLEEYCENIYQMSVGFVDERLCKKLYGKIKKQLTDLDNEIRYHLTEDKKQIVFFPYKASMWASLESVWRAAAADETCEAYVVPIPYYDKNPDGTLGRMHDESREYPPDVPVISWQEYLLQERRPDVAYIHNPYDACNYVTSVHPMFYAKELKQYVDKLVYIPYFTAVNDKVEPQFCVLPGTLYADCVIVQSEAVRQTYIEELRKFERENNCGDAFGNIEKKVLAPGSPAYDSDRTAVINNKDMPIPEEWKRIIYRTDGTGKKIVLYNTSIQNILTHGEAMLQKLSDSLRIFERRQSDIALLWRPHPLIPATLQSMRPSLWSEYREIVTGYNSAGWGIYDDSADMKRAILLSDAYYGDCGSLLALYKETGKPVMIQTILDK